MKKLAMTFVCSLLLVVSAPGMALSDAAKAQGLPSLAPMLEAVTPAVVSIRVTRAIPTSSNLPFRGEVPDELRRIIPNLPQGSQQPYARRAGSGVIIDAARGYIVTNNHVVESANEITVQLSSGRDLQARVIGSDANTDIALLQVEEDDLAGVSLMEIGFADIDTVAVGDYVVAIGNPFGIGQTVTQGIVSALGRAGLNNANYEDFIQTDAAINMGNSGGALVDLEGNLVGINTAIISGNGGSNGVGFAVPVDMMAAVIGHLERDGEVRRGMLGVTITDVTAEIAETMDLDVREGALVTSVLAGSAAEAAGLRLSDVIVAIDDEPVASSRELRNIIGLMRRDREVDVHLYRNGESTTLSAVIGGPGGEARQAAGGAAARSDFRGANLRSLDNAESEFSDSGVVVEAVQPGSRAATAGLRTGDIIVAVNRREVAALSDFNEFVAAADRLTAITVLREGREQLLLVP